MLYLEAEFRVLKTAENAGTRLSIPSSPILLFHLFAGLPDRLIKTVALARTGESPEYKNVFFPV